jgi:oligopeptide/dipeptide ABC transporter ATP-binding protein
MMGMLKPTSGEVRFGGADVADMDRKQLKALRSRLQMVYQNALGSLDSRLRIGASIAEPLRIHRRDMSRAEQRQRAIEVLEMVGLRPGEPFLSRFPGELSGGQQQRVAIARALITEPDALILDESLASADVSIRITLLDLLMELRERLSLTYVFITHELALARYLCDRLVILYRGEVVESGPTEAVFNGAQHPYTRALIDAVPAHGKSRFEDSPVQLNVDTLLVRSTIGCSLYGRCPIGVAGVCDLTAPELVVTDAQGHSVACHFASSGELAATPDAAGGDE